MEVHSCMELVERLLEESARKLVRMQQAGMGAEIPRAEAKRPPAVPTVPHPREYDPLQVERGWLEKAYHALTIAHKAFEQLAHCERRRGERAHGAPD
jgi:hypothetical protein